jgi:hypothetical protein
MGADLPGEDISLKLLGALVAGLYGLAETAHGGLGLVAGGGFRSGVLNHRLGLYIVQGLAVLVGTDRPLRLLIEQRQELDVLLDEASDRVVGGTEADRAMVRATSLCARACRSSGYVDTQTTTRRTRPYGFTGVPILMARVTSDPKR